MLKKLLLSFYLLSLITFVNAQSWMELGVGADSLYWSQGGIDAICIDAFDNVYIAGRADTAIYYNVFKWNGIHWSQVGLGANALNANAPIFALCIDDSGNIYAGGDFTPYFEAQGPQYIAKWNGSTWNQIKSGSNPFYVGGVINSITLGSGNIYASGGITNGYSQSYVAEWTGDTLIELINRTGSNVSFSRTDHSGNLYAVGDFSDTVEAFNIARWNGNSWVQLGTGANALDASALNFCIDNLGNIYAVCNYYIGNEKNNSELYIVVKWNGASWEELGQGVNALNANQPITSICADSLGNIYVGGAFTNAEGKLYIAKWNGSSWKELGAGRGAINASYIEKICAYDTNVVYAIGVFANKNGNYYVTRYLGSGAVIASLTTTSLCAGDSIVLNVNNTETGYAYQWNNSSGAIAGATNSSYIAKIADIYTVTVIGLGFTTTSLPVTLTPITATVVASSIAFCPGDSVTLKANIGIGLKYQWNQNSVPIIGATDSTYVVKEAGNYSVSVSSNRNCSISSSEVTITVNPSPSSSITLLGTPPFCNGDDVTLNANTGSSLTYQWNSPPGKAIPSSTNSSINVQITAPSSRIIRGVRVIVPLARAYTVTVSNGICSTTSDSIVIYGNPISVAGTNQYIIVDSTILQGNNAFPDTGTWSVVNGTGVFANPNNPTTSVTGLSEGTNILAWTITNGSCTPSVSQITINVSSPTAIISANSSDFYIIRPNPFTDYTSIRVATSAQEKLNMTLTSSNGIVLYSGLGKTNEDIMLGSDLPSGMYFAQITYGSVVKVIKVVKI